MGQPKRVVYRALIGGYEQLREEPVVHDTDISFICFTDDPTLTSETWQLVVEAPRFFLDLTRSSRALKILGHPVLHEYDETLWLDNTVALKAPPDQLFDDWLARADVAAPLHSFRRSVLAEAEAVIDGGFDDFARVYEQMTHYWASDGQLLDENPHWTGMLARRRTEKCAVAMQAWWEDVLRYSRRDKLSFIRAMRCSGGGGVVRTRGVTALGLARVAASGGTVVASTWFWAEGGPPPASGTHRRAGAALGRGREEPHRDRGPARGGHRPAGSISRRGPSSD